MTVDTVSRDKRKVDQWLREQRLVPPSDDEVTILPEMILEVQPEYPADVSGRRHEGTVWIRALVNKSGKVIDAIVAKSSDYPELDSAALEVAPKNKFKPAIEMNGL